LELEMAAAEPLVIFCDAVKTLGVHNGIVRISLIRLNAEGQAIPAVELLLPTDQLKTLVKALQQVRT
jgi:hypothetical protein